MDFGVTGSAERHEVGFLMTAAGSGGFDVMNQRSRNGEALLQTTLAERMLPNIQVADGSPPVTVGLFEVGAAGVSVILAPGDGFVLLAEASVSDECRASGIGTGVLGV